MTAYAISFRIFALRKTEVRMLWSPMWFFVSICFRLPVSYRVIRVDRPRYKNSPRKSYRIHKLFQLNLRMSSTQVHVSEQF